MPAISGRGLFAGYTSFRRDSRLLSSLRSTRRFNHECWAIGAENQIVWRHKTFAERTLAMLGDELRQPATPRRILIVEDNELNLKLLADVLGHHGYAITVTALGEAAIDLALKEQPDLILLDIKLPDLAGTEVAGRLKADPRTSEIPIIAVTAYAMQGDRGDILASGCDAYVPKPIRISELLELVARYLGRPGGTYGMADRRSGRDRLRRSSDRRLGERRVRKTTWTGFERRSGGDRRHRERRNMADRRTTPT